MRRLMLLRHAKSDQHSGVSEDHERPLNARGERAAERMGRYMKASNYQPKLVLCSTAERTRQTLEQISPYLGGRPEIRFERSLYLAEWPNILEALRELRDVSPVLVIGHNPGMEQLAIAMALQPANVSERGRAERLVHKYPTGALAVFDFNIRHWNSLRPGTGKLVDFMRPKDLPKDAEETA